jgi:hypothetical protein
MQWCSKCGAPTGGRGAILPGGGTYACWACFTKETGATPLPSTTPNGLLVFLLGRASTSPAGLYDSPGDDTFESTGLATESVWDDTDIAHVAMPATPPAFRRQR